MNTARRAILVLGPHRSGTSVVTRALLGAGVDLGKQLLEPNDDNPKGFFENARIVAFNDRLLKHIGLCWDYFGPMPAGIFDDASLERWQDEAYELLRNEFADAACIAIKDPRICLLAPFWNRVLADAGYAVDHVLTLRDPGECAQSQAARLRRDPVYHYVGGDLTEGLLLWARYLHEALKHLAGTPFAVASHARLLQTPERALDGLSSALSLELGTTATTEFAGAFVDPSLHRHHASTLTAADTEKLKQYRRAVGTLETLDPARMHDGTHAKTAATALASLLAAGPDVPSALARVFVRARHVAVEASLTFAEAKRILAYQEHALTEARTELEEAKRILAYQEHALKEARAELEEAKRILAFQEYALDQSRQRTADLEMRTIAMQNQFVEARRAAEHYSVENAALHDRLAQLLGTDDPDAKNANVPH